MWSPESSDQWNHPRVQMSFPSVWSSGPKHFTNVDLLLLNCLEPLDQRGSVESTRLRDDALIQVSAFYNWSSPQQRNEGPTGPTGEGEGGVLGTCWGRWWHTWAELTRTYLLHLFVHLLCTGVRSEYHPDSENETVTVKLDVWFSVHVRKSRTTEPEPEPGFF